MAPRYALSKKHFFLQVKAKIRGKTMVKKKIAIKKSKSFLNKKLLYLSQILNWNQQKILKTYGEIDGQILYQKRKY